MEREHCAPQQTQCPVADRFHDGGGGASGGGGGGSSGTDDDVAERCWLRRSIGGPRIPYSRYGDRQKYRERVGWGERESEREREREIERDRDRETEKVLLFAERLYLTRASPHRRRRRRLYSHTGSIHCSTFLYIIYELKSQAHTHTLTHTQAQTHAHIQTHAHTQVYLNKMYSSMHLNVCKYVCINVFMHVGMT